MAIRRFENTDIEISKSPRVEKDLADTLRFGGALTKGVLDVDLDFRTPEVEVQILRDLHIDESSTGFQRNRAPVDHCLRAIVHEAVDRLKINPGTGLDIGSGASGQMIDWLPPDLSRKWLQMEIHPEAIRLNRAKHPSARIVQGSYLHLQDQGVRNMFDCISGLSSLDATIHLERALEQIRDALKSGGILLHVQDVRPGLFTPLKQAEELGARNPFPIEFLMGKRGDVLLVETPQGMISGVELFRRRLGKLIADTPGLELIANDWVCASTANREVTNWYLANVLVTTDDRRDGSFYNEANAVVTLARKK